MSIIIDLIIVGILALCIILGYRKGLTGSLLKIVSFVLALVIAFVLFKPVSNFIIDKTNWDENLEQAIRDMVLEENNTTSDETDANEDDKEEDKKQSMPNVMMEYINQTVENAGNDAKEAIVDSTARDVSVTIINAGVWIALFILSRVVLFFVKGLANLITKLPVIKQFDKLGGIIYGILEGVIVVYVILAIISFASPLLSTTGVIGGIQKSFIGSIMYYFRL